MLRLEITGFSNSLIEQQAISFHKQSPLISASILPFIACILLIISIYTPDTPDSQHAYSSCGNPPTHGEFLAQYQSSGWETDTELKFLAQYQSSGWETDTELEFLAQYQSSGWETDTELELLGQYQSSGLGFGQGVWVLGQRD